MKERRLFSLNSHVSKHYKSTDMKPTRFLLTVCGLMVAMLAGSCSHKGSSSLASRKQTTTSRQTPKVKQTTSESAADRAARIKAEKAAEQKAKQEAEEAKQAALKAKADAEKAAKDAEQAAKEAEQAAKEAAAQKVVVKEEKVKIVETKADIDESHRYHIIIGSFKVLQNARQLCEDAIAKDFLPSIMENEEGMYRVGVYSSSTESTARTKIKEMRKKYPEYVGMWLLIEKK